MNTPTQTAPVLGLVDTIALSTVVRTAMAGALSLAAFSVWQSGAQAWKLQLICVVIAGGLHFRLAWARAVLMGVLATPIVLLPGILSPFAARDYPEWVPTWAIISFWLAIILFSLMSIHVLQVHRGQFRGHLPWHLRNLEVER